MKVLHVLASEPDAITTTLLETVSEGNQVTCFELFRDEVDYDELVDLVFDHDRVISWW